MPRSRKIDRDLDMMVDMTLRLDAGMTADRINTKMLRLDARKREKEPFITSASEPPALLHPEMACFYRSGVEDLHAALTAGTEGQRMAAVEALRSLIDKIILTPEVRELEIDVRGDLAGILCIATNAKSPAVFAARLSQFELVAGTGFEPVTFRL